MQSLSQQDRRSFLFRAAAFGFLTILKRDGRATAQNTVSPAGSGSVRPRLLPDTEDQRLNDLVVGNHILFDQGIVDGFGHISVRSLKDPSHYFMSQSRAPALVTRSDIMEFDLDSRPIDQRGRPIYGERFIHGEIYRARADVQSVVHSHATAVIPFSVTGIPLGPLIHTAGFLPETVPTFEIRDVAGPDNDMLIGNNALGAALAKALGTSPVILMRGHGMVVVGPSVRHAVYRAIYTQLDAQVEIQALQIGSGKVRFLNPMEAANVDLPNERGLLTEDARQWNLWVREANANSVRLNGRP